MSLSDSSLPEMARILAQVLVWLDEAQAYAEQKKVDPEVLLTARLAPDQSSRRRTSWTSCSRRNAASRDQSPMKGGRATSESIKHVVLVARDIDRP
ncbi:DUF1993 family protein [Sorangium sp. So ce363]|uniref:DUF1993 family protein n=1 Tax=Sorangium sp. So ce363 TaxID=3133304 RepID=UPI003F62BF62